jgi:predicted amidohydrolase YtcJ
MGVMSFQWFVLAMALGGSAAAQVTADLVVKNAVIHTMDSKGALAEALAVKGERIIAVGSAGEIARVTGAGTRVIDAGGRLVLPGFNDSHVHFLGAGFQLSSVDLRDAKTQEEFARRIRDFAAKLPKGEWVLGGRWDHESWPGAKLPDKGLIDRYTPETPVFVERLDGHMALANSVVLKLAGVTRETKDPDGGMIVRDAAGEPTGVLKDAAMNLVYRKVPEHSFEVKLGAARAASRYAASVGVTSVQDMSSGKDVAVYQELERRGELLTRIYAVTSLPEWKDIAGTGIRAPFGSTTLRIGGLKGFADGSLGSTTAWFFDSYNDAVGATGLASDEMHPPEAMLDRIRAADRAGLQVMIHAIGDKANGAILSMYEQVGRENGARDRRFRIEHAQHLRLRDIPRFGAAGVIASMQPLHAADDGRWAEKRIGPDRIHGAYAFRSLLDSKAVLAFGSDWPVASVNPIAGLDAAVTRRTLDGKNPGGWVPEQKITVQEAVHAYTWGSAYAEFQEKEKGTLEAGKLADFVVLSEDVFRIAPERIGETKVVTTVMGGHVVFERK